MYSRCGIAASFFGSLVSPSRKALSNFELIRPARGPEIWCDMPPVPNTTTRRSSLYDATALRIARPRSKQRLPVGGGYCTTFTAIGITGQGHAEGEPNARLSGTVRP